MNRIKQDHKKLALARETLAWLTKQELKAVAGGRSAGGCGPESTITQQSH